MKVSPLGYMCRQRTATGAGYALPNTTGSAGQSLTMKYNGELAWSRPSESNSSGVKIYTTRDTNILAATLTPAASGSFRVTLVGVSKQDAYIYNLHHDCTYTYNATTSAFTQDGLNENLSEAWVVDTTGGTIKLYVIPPATIDGVVCSVYNVQVNLLHLDTEATTTFTTPS